MLIINDPKSDIYFHHNLVWYQSTSIIKRGQHCIPNLTDISSRGHYQYPRRTLIFWFIYESWLWVYCVPGEVYGGLFTLHIVYLLSFLVFTMCLQVCIVCNFSCLCKTPWDLGENTLCTDWLHRFHTQTVTENCTKMSTLSYFPHYLKHSATFLGCLARKSVHGLLNIFSPPVFKHAHEINQNRGFVLMMETIDWSNSSLELHNSLIHCN